MRSLGAHQHALQYMKFKNMIINKNLNKNMPKMRYFFEKSVKSTRRGGGLRCQQQHLLLKF